MSFGDRSGFMQQHYRPADALFSRVEMCRRRRMTRSYAKRVRGRPPADEGDGALRPKGDRLTLVAGPCSNTPVLLADLLPTEGRTARRE